MQPVPSIFVSIASYRDLELIPTLHDMINTAKCPENLNIAICWQDESDINTFLDQGFQLIESTTHQGYPLYQLEYNRARIWVLSVHYYQSRGACWARYMAETLFQNEAFFLQIDSHCRFVPQWDHEMISMLDSLREKSPKPILSNYPPAYVPEEPGKAEIRREYISRMIFNTFTAQGIVQMTSKVINETAPLRSCYLAGGFIFSDGHFVRSVPNDPQIFFIGEEIAMAARAFTHGYDVYTPHKIMLWHFYTRAKSTKVWSDHNNEAKKTGSVDMAWWERDKIAKERVRTLFDSDKDASELGIYTLGTQRTLQEFEYRLGACIKRQAVHPDVVGEKKISYFAELPDSREDWLQSLVFSNKKVLKIEKKDVDFLREDVEWWHIGVYAEQNIALMVKKIEPLDKKDKTISTLDDSTFELKLDFTTQTESKAQTIRICPYIRAQGWGDVVEKPW